MDALPKRVVVLGLGRQGMAMVRFFARAGVHVRASDKRDARALADRVAELRDLGVELVLGGHPLSLLDGADMLALSGGIPLTLPIVQEARHRGIPLVSDAELTLRYAVQPTVGITGSAGKTTTTTLVGLMAQRAGWPVQVGGNIGTPLLDRLDALTQDTWLVLELSSFQLELCTHSPHVAAVLNVTPNHLDRHPSMEAYAEAKRNIFRYQQPGDKLILGWDNEWTRGWARRAVPSGVRLFLFSLEEEVPLGTYVRGDRLLLRDGEGEQLLCRVEEIPLRGRHNVANVLAAAAVAGAMGVPVDAIREAVRTFRGVPHRLEEVARHRGVLWVNDSIATAPERVVAALRSFDEPIVLLAGGKDKNLPWDEFARVAGERVRWVIAFGDAGPLVERVLRPYVGRSRIQGVEVVRDLEAAVRRAAAVAQPGEVVLLSPGGTSFDAYQNFEERGEHFRQLVRSLVNEVGHP
ncbi:MAG: UDP-N-acetylmuramoyl-L-alanine--D-glutamate ligase [Chloroflexi bacterium]|nr:UDP-N-acetylmuramoyl-L-alanine--D-glutamate ligase [Chloroflexota bacterium]